MIENIELFNTLKTSWDESVSQLGGLKPSKNGHTSIFLYPYNYSFLKKGKNWIESLENRGWIYQQDRSFDFHNASKLTDYVEDALFGKNFIFTKSFDQSYELWVDGSKKSDCFLSNIEVVFFESNIAIISLFTSSGDSIHTISTVLNRELRNPSCIYFDKVNSRILSFDRFLENIENIKAEYSSIEGNELLAFNNYIFGLIEEEKLIKLSELKSGKSKYAKYITTIHTDTDETLENKLLYSYPELQHQTDVSLNVLQICSNHLATSNDFIAINKKFESDIDYVRANVKNHGIRLWSCWSGMASLNSLAFVSINDGGRSIVHQSNNEIYLIYLINYYIKLRLQHLDKLIIDESFMQQNKSRENMENLFILKAKYFSEEIADSFQPVIIDKKIKSALGIDILMKTIEENIVKTNQIIKDNNSAVVAIIVAIYVSLNEIIPHFTNSFYIKIFLIVLTSVIAFLLWKKRNIIGQNIDRLLKYIGVI
jgi:hypothetical protein